ncbi:hypothetical protein MMC24_005555 [Lignoscripta atroalba]|nr:hypothetical protein [Lignoscripta atroalba]
MKISFSDLPTEVHSIIAGNLQDLRDLRRLSMTCSHLLQICLRVPSRLLLKQYMRTYEAPRHLLLAATKARQIALWRFPIKDRADQLDRAMTSHEDLFNFILEIKPLTFDDLRTVYKFEDRVLLPTLDGIEIIDKCFLAIFPKLTIRKAILHLETHVQLFNHTWLFFERGAMSLPARRQYMMQGTPEDVLCALETASSRARFLDRCVRLELNSDPRAGGTNASAMYWLNQHFRRVMTDVLMGRRSAHWSGRVNEALYLATFLDIVTHRGLEAINVCLGDYEPFQYRRLLRELEDRRGYRPTYWGSIVNDIARMTVRAQEIHDHALLHGFHLP